MALITSYMPDPPPKVTRQTPALDDFNSSSRQVAAGPSHTGQSAKWQEAQERVLLYLKLLGIVSPASLDIARRVLELAAARGQDDKNESVIPVAGAMRVLHRLLADDPSLLQQTPLADYPSLYRRWRPTDQRPAHLPQESGKRDDFIAVPAISRGFMRTKRIA